MRGDHNLGVLPFGGPVVAGDQAHAVQATEVAEHEGIAGLCLVGRAVGEREVPGRVLIPTWVFRKAFWSAARGWTSAHRLRNRY